MQEPEIKLLAPGLRPLLGKFYHAHRSHMPTPNGAAYWIAIRGDIIGGLCLSTVEHGYWLTGLLVSPQERQQGRATKLIQHALESVDRPVWLFCHPRLQGFYERLGFTSPAALPEPLQARLKRYLQHKSLVALQHDHEVSP